MFQGQTGRTSFGSSSSTLSSLELAPSASLCHLSSPALFPGSFFSMVAASHHPHSFQFAIVPDSTGLVAHLQVVQMASSLSFSGQRAAFPPPQRWQESNLLSAHLFPQSFSSSFHLVQIPSSTHQTTLCLLRVLFSGAPRSKK